MTSLKEIRTRIQSVSSTQQITKAMKMVSASKLRLATTMIHSIRLYSDKLIEIVNNVSLGIDKSSFSLMEKRATSNVLLVVVTSNKGLAGVFNSSVIRYTNQLINEKYKDIEEQGGVYLYCIGKKGYDFYKRRNKNIFGSEFDVFKHINFEDIEKVGEKIMGAYVAKQFDKVEIIYNSFKNPAVQIVRQEQIFPFSDSSTEEGKKGNTANYIFEPNAESILEKLIPSAINTQIYKAVADSNASEHAARMVAMDNATENAEKLISELRLSYNQARQATVTNELLEIVSGANALTEE